jgi:hypothetical protein
MKLPACSGVSSWRTWAGRCGARAVAEGHLDPWIGACFLIRRTKNRYSSKSVRRTFRNEHSHTKEMAPQLNHSTGSQSSVCLLRLIFFPFLLGYINDPPPACRAISSDHILAPLFVRNGYRVAVSRKGNFTRKVFQFRFLLYDVLRHSDASPEPGSDGRGAS